MNRYYKIVQDGVIIDANDRWLVWNTKHRQLFACEPQNAQYIQSSNETDVWHGNWLNPEPPELRGMYDTIPIKAIAGDSPIYAEEITEEEYLAIRAILDDGKTIPEKEEEVEEPQDEEEKDMTLDSLKQIHVAALSQKCENTIYEGYFHNERRFGLSIKDQIELSNLSMGIASGMTEVDYYDWDGNCLTIPAAECMEMVAIATLKVQYCRAFFHCLEHWVNACEDAVSIRNINWDLLFMPSISPSAGLAQADAERIRIPAEFISEYLVKYATAIGDDYYAVKL